MRVVPVPQLIDNYAYLVVDEDAGVAGVVDCAEAGPVLAAVQDEGVRLVSVLATHHHFDHVGGNEELLGRCDGLTVFGSADDAPRIPGITNPVADGDTLMVGTLEARVILIPAHTSGHIAYYFAEHDAVFTGDTLFAGGCGRLFEGDAAQMMSSLNKLASLPDRTRIYFGHEYTEKNLQFAFELEPGNDALSRKLQAVIALRRDGQPTVPSSIAEEKATNPFLRTASEELASSVAARMPGLAVGDAVALFAAVRSLKDRY